MRIFLIAAAAVALPMLAACGNDTDAAPPAITQADLSKSLQDKGLQDPKLAECAAKLYVEQGISQEGLRKMTGSEYDTKVVDPTTLGMSKEDADKARQATGKIVSECLAQH
ncbi:hypothetical protein [Nocardia sp. NBC_01009]|uniref:hypothetical protein n=1 Tax=Nocardia sp. NBC_01009 TaxID=2975996 RepID=UPI00386E0BF6|nr:hypothetical protein OHA42_03140 [Nocardia sp. NBC_01009]